MNRVVLALAVAVVLAPAPAFAGDETFTCSGAAPNQACQFKGEIDPQTTAVFKGVCTDPSVQNEYMTCYPASDGVTCTIMGMECTCDNGKVKTPRDPKALGYATVNVICPIPPTESGPGARSP